MFRNIRFLLLLLLLLVPWQAASFTHVTFVVSCSTTRRLRGSTSDYTYDRGVKADEVLGYGGCDATPFFNYWKRDFASMDVRLVVAVIMNRR